MAIITTPYALDMGIFLVIDVMECFCAVAVALRALGAGRNGPDNNQSY